MEPNQTQPKSNGALVGSIVIIVLLIIGGLYLWKNSAKEEMLPENSNISGGDDIDASAAAIEAELNGMDLDSLDSEI
jgi:hypothetical protein